VKQLGLTQDISLNVEGLIISLSEGVQSIAKVFRQYFILPNFAKSLCILVVVVARSSVVAMRTSGFVDDVTFFSHNGPYGASCICIL